MGAAAWLTLAVLAAAVAAMAREWLEPALALGGAVGVLLLAGVLPVEDALAGFASPAVAIVALMLVLAGTLERSRWIRWLTGVLFGGGGGRATLLRSLPPVAILSGFLNNTPVVAVLIPAVREWARRRGQSSTRFLMPLSFAAIMGGTFTLIGTSTNLVVHGMLLDAGLPGFGVFELGRAGVPLAVLGVGFLVVVGWRFLPDRDDPLEEAARNTREYAATLRVHRGSPLVGDSVGDLRSLEGLYLAGIEREGELRTPVEPDAVIEGGDTLVFVGLVETLAELAAMPGVTARTDDVDAEEILESEETHLVEAVVSPSSPIVGRNVREAGFRGRYDAVVVAVHRHGERIVSKVGDIVLHPGDTLLLLAGPDFLERWRYSRDFYLVSEAGSVPRGLRLADWLEPAVLVGVVSTAAAGIFTILEAAVAGVLLLLATRRLRADDVWRSLHWPTLIVIATAIGVGNALVASGAAEAFAGTLVEWGSALGPAGVVGAVFLATALLTEIVANVAAAALVFPVALSAAEAGIVGLHPLAVAVAIGASVTFLTPIGYQTNTMVAGAAGYSFGDFFRAGIGLKILYVVVGAVLIPMVWGTG